MLALTGVNVVELGDSTALRYCGRMLASLGATVISVRDTARTASTASAVDAYLDANKYIVEAELASDAGRETLKTAVAAADALLASYTSSEMRDFGLDVEPSGIRQGGLVLASITPWGSDGHPTMRRAPELLQFHGGGLGSITPRFANNPADPPLRLGYPMSEFVSGLTAAVCVMAAFQHLEDTGEGAVIDVSGQQAIAHAESLYMAYASYEGRSTSRVTRPGLAPFHFLRCLDGYVMIICPEEHQWRGLVELMGSPSWAQSELFATSASRAEYWDAIEPQLLEWLAGKKKQDLYHLGQSKRVPIVPVNNVDGVLSSEQLSNREFFQPLMVGSDKLLAPGLPFRSTGEMARALTDPPTLNPEAMEQLTSRRAKLPDRRLRDDPEVRASFS